MTFRDPKVRIEVYLYTSILLQLWLFHKKRSIETTHVKQYLKQEGLSFTKCGCKPKRSILKSFQFYFSNKGLKETAPNLQPEQTTIEQVLCSTYFEDIVLIEWEMLIDTTNDDNYQEIPIEQIRKVYFNQTCYHFWTHGHKRKYSTPPS